jgi:E3 ubiquitin-protein ligase TRIP12
MSITHLVDIFPNVGNIVVSSGGISALCEKLGNFEFIDSAEHAIKALEKISHENAPAILKEGGFEAILNLLDFFELNT